MSTPPQEIPKVVPKALHRFVGNGNFIPALVPHYNKFPILQQCNSVYNLAPASKWALSLIPFFGAVTGTQPVEKINFNTSASLTATGCIWTIYALMIQPQNAGSKMLATVNFAMATVNGYNCVRRKRFDDALAASSSTQAGDEKK